MFIMRDEMWNNVVVYGPQSEIDRFKKRCLSPFPLGNVHDPSEGFDPDRIVLIETDVFNEETWNFREPKDQERDTYAFNFDTHTRFPATVFERLAELFPALAFDCECIADNDDSMGYGWFNPPPGGEEFRDDYDVPVGYWTNGGSKRSTEAERQHHARINRLQQAIRKMGGD